MIIATMHVRGHPEDMIKGFRQAAKEENARLARYWHAHMLPDHFKTSAVRRYGYQKRTARYMRRKARLYGHQRPLEKTGELRAMVTRMARITSTAKGGRATMTGPRHLYAHRPGTDPDKRAELTAVTADEAEAMAQILDRRIGRRLRRVRQPRKMNR